MIGNRGIGAGHADVVGGVDLHLPAGGDDGDGVAGAVAGHEPGDDHRVVDAAHGDGDVGVVEADIVALDGPARVVE